VKFRKCTVSELQQSPLKRQKGLCAYSTQYFRSVKAILNYQKGIFR